MSSVHYPGFLSLGVLLSFCGYVLMRFLLRTPRLPKVFAVSQNRQFLESELLEIYNAPTVDLSVVIPAYNEEQRLPSTLKSITEYFQERKEVKRDPLKYEIIIVDDGSTDRTVDTCLPFLDRYGTIFRIFRLYKNCGKGAAVQAGVLRSRGSQILFADADNATCFRDIEKLEASAELLDNYVVCGSRPLDNQLVKRSFMRQVLMRCFGIWLKIFGVSKIKDTQCGFKLFSRQAALSLFPSLRVKRWAFDVELLTTAEMLRIDIVEVPVNWTEMKGSKVVPVFSWISMAFDIWMIWLRGKLRKYTRE